MKLLWRIFKFFIWIVLTWLLALVIAGLITLPATPPAPPLSTEELSKWRSELRLGLLKKQVREILGEPDHVRVTYVSEEWSYKNGNVEFSTDDGKVVRWDEPS